MSLDPPTLDDRSFDDLLADARKLLPAYTDEWTDHNVHDPGITVLELLAWLTETYGYQLDQLTDEHVRKYLRLLGETPTPPRSARVALSLSPSAVADGAVLPRGTTVLAEVGGRTVGFETTRSVAVTDAELAHVVGDHRRGRTDNTTANSEESMHFLGFGPRAERGATLNLGFAGDPFAGDAVDISFDFREADLPSVGAHRDESGTFQPTVELQWEYLTDARQWFDDDAWAPLSLATDDADDPLDTTDRFYRGGHVRLTAPDSADWSAVDRAGRVFDAPAGRYWLRCRVVAGGYEIPPVFDAIRVNSVPAVQQTTVGPVDPASDDAEVLVRAERRLGAVGAGGDSASRRDADDRPRPTDETLTTDLPDQRFLLPDAPVLDATIHVREPGEPPALWTEVVDLDASGPTDSHYVREPTTGVIRFGDGVTGRVPPAGSEVVASEYVVGGGSVSVPQESQWSLVTDSSLATEIEVSALSPVIGGADAESVDDALVRVRRGLLDTSRAVTPEDYRELARSTPGVRVARATATTHEVPGPGDCDPVTAVRVVVVPHSTLPESTPPEPSRGLLDAVDAHLQRHRLLTDRVSVAAPIYVGVRVAVGVELDEGFTAEGRITAVADALDDFLDPLTGFDGEGWPFGRPVYRAELYEQITGVAGIDCVRTLSVSADGGRVTDEGTVVIDPTGLVYSAGHDVTVLTDDADCRRRR